MHLTDLRILAKPWPGCIVEGRFSLEAPHHPGEPVSADGAEIGFFMGADHAAALHLGDFVQTRSGLYAGAKSGSGYHLSLTLPHAIKLEPLLWAACRSTINPGRRCVEDAEASLTGPRGYVAGAIPVLEIQAEAVETGLRVRFSGEVAFRGGFDASGAPLEPDPALADSRIVADIVVPWTFLALQRSELAILGGPFRDRDAPPGDYFDFERPGLAGVAVDRNGDSYFRGQLAIQGARVRSACVRARITDSTLELFHSLTPLVQPDGFVIAGASGAPKLTLFGLGYDAWTKALRGGATGRLELRGDCVGYITEAWVIDAVAGRHAVAACTLDLALDETELVLTVRGEVDRILQYVGPSLPPTMGPGFEATVRIPTAFLAVRGVDLVSWGASEHRLLKGESWR